MTKQTAHVDLGTKINNQIQVSFRDNQAYIKCVSDIYLNICITLNV